MANRKSSRLPFLRPWPLHFLQVIFRTTFLETRIKKRKGTCRGKDVEGGSRSSCGNARGTSLFSAHATMWYCILKHIVPTKFKLLLAAG